MEEEWRCRDEIQGLIHSFESKLRQFETNALQIVGNTDAQFASGDITTKVSKQPVLPCFSGKLPVPPGESTYEQYIFQIRGFRMMYTDTAIKASIVGTVKGDTREYLNFAGTDRDLDDLIEGLDQWYGDNVVVDRLFKNYFQIMQRRGETVSQFASRLETVYKRLVRVYPERCSGSSLKERLFAGMTQHLRDSLRYLFKRKDTTYEELLITAQEAELEWMNNSTPLKATHVKDPGKVEREILNASLDRLTQQVRETPNTKIKGSKGMKTNSHGPFREGQHPVQCYKCGGWGHFRRECPTSGNVKWEMLNRVKHLPWCLDPRNDQMW